LLFTELEKRPGSPSDPGPDLVQDDPPFGTFQLTEDEVQSVLLELDVSKGLGLDGIPPLVLKTVHLFLRVHFIFFLKDLFRLVFFLTAGLREPVIQKRQAQQRRGLSWGGYIICN
jgi:hypothetical protein